AGNTSAASSALAVTVDTTVPTATIALSDDVLNAGDTATVTITFDAAVTGLEISDLTVQNGSLSALATTDGGVTWTATLTPAATTAAATNTITLAKAGVQDLAGNAGVDTEASSNYEVDTISPTATLTASGNINNQGSVTVRSNEPGIAYLVKNTLDVSGVASITGVEDSQWNSVSITTTDTDTTLSASGLADGTYVVYTTDAAGNLSSVTTNSVLIDSTAPSVSSVAISGATGKENNTLNAGDVVSVTVTMSESVTVTGTPQLTIEVGSASRTASYVSGSGSSALVFTYSVQAGDTDANGIAVPADSLSLNGGAIKDVVNNDAMLTFSAVAANASYMVDTTADAAPAGLDLAAGD
ncbi:MAG: Ig-like domain-containing protein, partial [Chlorobium phaeovibrioides]|nr:Ig-like domain-containing protein [Chlorobium phaeovibrioides]